MIQRIQSIYLLLASLGFGGLFMFPFATSSQAVPHLLEDMIYNIQDSPILLALTIIGALIALVAIFLFNNRKLQQKMSIVVIICSIFIPLVAFLLIYNEGTAFNDQTTQIDDGMGIFMPVLSTIFGFLAFRSIKKDDNLVRSMDRLR